MQFNREPSVYRPLKCRRSTPSFDLKICTAPISLIRISENTVIWAHCVTFVQPCILRIWSKHHPSQLNYVRFQKCLDHPPTLFGLIIWCCLLIPTPTWLISSYLGLGWDPKEALFRLLLNVEEERVEWFMLSIFPVSTGSFTHLHRSYQDGFDLKTQFKSWFFK